MKAISIKQPWAWMIIHGGKNVENRTWHTNYRGPILIHASKKFDRDGYLWILENAPKLFSPGFVFPGWNNYQCGGIVGKADLVMEVRSCTFSPWMFGPWGFVLENPKSIDFIPCKGQLGIFNIDLDI
jgi:hypothetical protein